MTTYLPPGQEPPKPGMIEPDGLAETLVVVMSLLALAMITIGGLLWALTEAYDGGDFVLDLFRAGALLVAGALALNVGRLRDG